MPPQTQVNSATLVMGVTGSGKSALLHTLAKYVWRRWKKVTLYYNTDGGGYPAKIQEVQALGLMRVFRMLTRDPGDLGLAFETCYRACQGWWPKIIDPRTGEVPPGVEMVPPISIRYRMLCPSGHLVKDVPAQSLLTPGPCPTCRLMVTAQSMKVQRVVQPNRGFEDVGAVCYDGLSSMLAWGMRDLGHRAGWLELKGEEAAFGGKVISGDLKFGGTTRSHVGFAQTRGEELVHLTLGIPNLVVPPIFTALTHEDVDERSLSIIGPKIAGRAKTDEAPQWFGNVMETAKMAALDGSNAEQRILYLSEFTDAHNVRHLLKHRGAPGTMPAYLADPPGGDDNPAVAFTQVNLGLFFEMLAAALEKGIVAARAEIPDAPGLPEGLVEIGDASIIAPQPVVTPQEGVGPQAMLSGPQMLTGAGPAAPPTAPPAAAPVPRGRKRAQAAGSPPAAVPALPPTPPPTPVAAAVVVPVASGVTQVAPAPGDGGAAMTSSPVSSAAPAAPSPAPAQAPAASPPQPTGATGAPARPAGAAPPPGRRPAPSAPTPVAAANLSVAPVPSAAVTTPAQGTMPGPIAGPGAPRPPAGAPRPPAAAPRPTGAGTRLVDPPH